MVKALKIKNKQKTNIKLLLLSKKNFSFMESFLKGSVGGNFFSKKFSPNNFSLRLFKIKENYIINPTN